MFQGKGIFEFLRYEYYIPYITLYGESKAVALTLYHQTKRDPPSQTKTYARHDPEHFSPLKEINDLPKVYPNKISFANCIS